jgi:hypothetical protein
MNLDNQALAWQLVMLLSYLPVVAAMAISGVWALMRLHERPRAGWIVLIVIALSGFQLTGSTAVWLFFGSVAGFLNPEYVSYAMMILNHLLELAIWGLLLLGLFGPDPFRWGSLPAAEDDLQ